ncbi:hypothetical protein ACFOEK_07000 [Litoribrevibacter euphylliae]|uniref:Uncharacterized protein n=1 Tax=Litoribrevibacter euphylliae TaxID=1834034 RepID=A0ABV7HA23_9GAMM
MKNFSISHIYPEPGVNFKISHKVVHYLKIQLQDLIELNDPEQLRDKSLVFTVSTKYSCENFHMLGPIDSRDEVVWTIWLPYEEFSNLDEELEGYLNMLSSATHLILKNYDVDKNEVDSVFMNVKSEVLGNKKYEYKELAIPMPDFDQLGIDIKNLK